MIGNDKNIIIYVLYLLNIKLFLLILELSAVINVHVIFLLRSVCLAVCGDYVLVGLSLIFSLLLFLRGAQSMTSCLVNFLIVNLLHRYLV